MEKKDLKAHFAKMFDKQQCIEGKGFLHWQKVKIKPKDDKMTISGRYFEGCRRDLSGCPSETK